MVSCNGPPCSCFSYVQVDLAIRALRERAGRAPLLILPSGYLEGPAGGLVPNHTRSNRLNESQVHTLSAEETAITS